MNVLKRVVSTKRHTIGYVVSGMGKVSRTSAVQLARRSRLRGVRVMNGPNGAYLVSETGRSLYNLPVVIDREAIRSDSPRARRNNRRQTSSRSR